MGATPDGIVCDKEVVGIIEIKCPYSARNLSIVESVRSLHVPNFCIVQTAEGLKLNEIHAYDCRIQEQLLITGAPFCDFIVFTKTDLYVERINPNVDFINKLFTCLCAFYTNHVCS